MTDLTQVCTNFEGWWAQGLAWGHTLPGAGKVGCKMVVCENGTGDGMLPI